MQFETYNFARRTSWNALRIRRFCSGTSYFGGRWSLFPVLLLAAILIPLGHRRAIGPSVDRAVRRAVAGVGGGVPPGVPTLLAPVHRVGVADHAVDGVLSLSSYWLKVTGCWGDRRE